MTPGWTGIRPDYDTLFILDQTRSPANWRGTGARFSRSAPERDRVAIDIGHDQDRTLETQHEVPIHDIMRPIGRLPAITIEDLEATRVGDLVYTFNEVHEEHMLAIEGTRDLVRGDRPGC